MTLARLMAGLERRGALLAAAAAALCALPGLRFPYLSDDWIFVSRAAARVPGISALGYFRPLYLATFWLDRRVWGLSPALFHLTNLLLLAAAAALVVVVVARYTRDRRLALLAGLFFAIHPYHVENAAWVSVRGDPLYASLLLLAALAYDAWRDEDRGVPLAAAALFEAALLAKESAVVLPAALLAIGVLDRTRRLTARELLRGTGLLLLVAALHFYALRPLVMPDRARSLAQGSLAMWAKSIPTYALGSVLPVDIELLSAHRLVLAALGGVLLGALALLARRRAGRVPPIAGVAALLFLVLIAPASVGLQERYLFLAAAASSMGLASLILALGPRGAALGAGAVAAAWLPLTVVEWRDWSEAAAASRSLVGGLVTASLEPGINEIVVANMPFRVRGGAVYVYEEFVPALEISGGRPVPVRAAAYVSYPRAASDALDGLAGGAIRRPPPVAEVRLRVPKEPFSQYAGPRPRPGSTSADVLAGSVQFDPDGVIRVRIPPAPGRAAYVWEAGALSRLF